MSTHYLIAGPITQSEIIKLLAKMEGKTNSGGHSVFIGQVRADEINGKKVAAIEYSAYDGMVQEEADKMINSIMSEFSDLTSVDILHSTGIVKAGEISLIVLASAGHRRQAIEACSQTVELIKERLPVWKKEIFEDNTHEWRQNTSS